MKWWGTGVAYIKAWMSIPQRINELNIQLSKEKVEGKNNGFLVTRESMFGLGIDVFVTPPRAPQFVDIPITVKKSESL